MSEYIVEGAEPSKTTLHYRTPNGYEVEKWLVVREEIVRCRDCANIVWTDNPMTTTHYWCSENDCPTDREGFCSWAVKSDSERIESIYDWGFVRKKVGEEKAEAMLSKYADELRRRDA